MEKYNYYNHVYDAVLWTVKNEYDLNEYNTRDEAEEALHNALWTDDSVTGNGYGINITSSDGKFWCFNCDAQDATIAIRLNTFQEIHLCPWCFKQLKKEINNYIP